MDAEAPVQDMTGEWLPLREAARRYGLDHEALRKRLLRGSIAGEKRDGQWFVLTPDGASVHPVEASASTPASIPSELTPESPLAIVEHSSIPSELPPAVAEHPPKPAVPAEIAAELAAIKEQVAEQRGRLEEMERARALMVETITDQRRRLDYSERERDELRQLLAAAVVASRQLPEPVTASEPRPAAENGSEAQSVSHPGEAHSTSPQRPWWRFW